MAIRLSATNGIDCGNTNISNVLAASDGDEAVNKAQLDAEAISAGAGLQKSGTTLNFYPFGLTTASTELTTSDYVVVSDSTTPKKITLANFANELPLLGVGQTWQDVTASRALNTTYTNSTGKPILVNISTIGDIATGVDAILTIDSVIIAKASSADASGPDEAFVSGIIPPGSTYKYTRVYGTSFLWAELR